ncbi:UDP-N-acetylmuramoyl-L-alanyl-D-glutamate--2,6-diaminopimelate ligase [Candidatus Shapirobacteria bacterium CG_4_9_14_3_um_filter_39_13]|uniref:UDP-N-acetylmuramoyl-L-alanyl-D-glutamate--2, 6-diaminopimelate ligase n=3 Tax=Microgenomates group TaxID=1794810 RepID=A0A2M7XM64_9BACT|nr:MAG: UDP-N-acetylmuramoyl-L-alanyl-D-glutamate--2,6-diaminopimelate ligase [Candidatus Shapirobacteria bacterium CG_4_9_14_3_um_filter_39_13]
MLWSKFRQSYLGEKTRALFPDLMVNQFKHLPLAILAVLWFRHPARRLKVIGVTGTDGKTTTATLIDDILVHWGKKAALISTVAAKIGQKEIDTGFHVTSPDAWKLQRLLRETVNQGFEYVVLEATSHGLVQNRFFGCHFKMGIVTNITHEHLDYHKTYADYLKAKAKLFDQVEAGVLNRDDQSFAFLKQKLKEKKIKIISYALKNKADFTPRNFPFKTPLLGDYNQYNCLAAAAATSFLGAPKNVIKEALADFPGVKGRLEEIKNRFGFRVFIDFASTANSLKNVLIALRKIVPAKGRLIAVFGSAGLRDVQKRGLMGEMAAKYADLMVLTAEDPRTEDVNQIIEQIAQGALKEGAQEGKTLFRVADRAEAIKFAIQKLAKKGDIVVTCGKGHEQSMCYGKTERPWSEHQAVQEALEGRNV